MGPRSSPGGQWQKIALARAFMREEADILVLDEPTAALDAEAEHAVFERFRVLAQNRTTMVISSTDSRPSACRRGSSSSSRRAASSEEGSHEDLLARGGPFYARMFALQAEGYR